MMNIIWCATAVLMLALLYFIWRALEGCAEALWQLYQLAKDRADIR